MLDLSSVPISFFDDLHCCYCIIAGDAEGRIEVRDIANNFTSLKEEYADSTNKDIP